MAGTFIGKYDTTAGSNSATASNSVSVAEGMLPSNINDAFRDVMADIRQWYNTAEWIEYGDGAGTYTPTYVSSTSFKIGSANVTSIYHVGRRVKVTASTPGTIYGSITAVSFSSDTTVTVSFDSGSLSNEAITQVCIGAISATNTSMPETTAITGDYTIDATGDIILDADGGDILFKDAATTFGSATNTSGNLIIKSGTTTALTMSGANVTVAGDLTISGDDLVMATNTSGAALIADGTNFNPVVISGDIAIATNGTASIAAGSIVNADVNASAAIDATKIHDGTISNTEFGHLNGINSNIQTQIDNVTAGSVSTIDDDNFFLRDNADTTKKAQFQCSAISTSTTRTYTLPDENGNLMTSVANDTTPQLGGDLDMNGQDIVTTSNADVEIAPNGTGHLVVKGNTNAGAIQLNCEANTHGQQIQAQPHSAGVTNELILPAGANSTLVSLVSSDTLTNKTLTSPVISEIVSVSNGNIALTPNGTGEVRISGSMNSTLSSTGKAMVLGF